MQEQTAVLVQDQNEWILVTDNDDKPAWWSVLLIITAIDAAITG